MLEDLLYLRGYAAKPRAQVRRIGAEAQTVSRATSAQRGVRDCERRVLVERVEDLVVAELDAPRGEPRGVGDVRRRWPAGVGGECEQLLEVVDAGGDAGEDEGGLGPLLDGLLGVETDDLGAAVA